MNTAICIHLIQNSWEAAAVNFFKKEAIKAIVENTMKVISAKSNPR
jgi:hypothetical protein